MILTLTLNPALDSLIFLDHLQWHEKNIAAEKRLYYSGKGFNVAKALSSLGRPVTALGFVGRADIPRYQQAFDARRVPLALTPLAFTRTNLKIIERDTGLETEINEAGAPAAASDWDDLHVALSARLPVAQWLVLSGSLAPGLPVSLYGEVIQEAKQAGVKTLLDTSGDYLRAALPSGPTVLRINRYELREITGVEADSPADLATASAALLANGTELVVVSLGREGAIAVGRGEHWLAVPSTVQVVNAIGAGDVMSAGVLDGLERGLELGDLLRWATALASASVLTFESGDVDPERARAVEGQVALTRL